MATIAKERVQFGLKNAHYAVWDEATKSYGEVKPIPGAVTLSIEPEGDTSTFYADDKPYFSLSANGGYTGTFECADFPEYARIDLLGDVRDANGMVLEDSDAVPASFALMYEVSSNLEPARFEFFNCTLSRPNNEHNTKSDTVEPDVVSLDFSAIARTFEWGAGTKNFTKGHLLLTDESETAYNGFFDEVLLPSMPTGGDVDVPTVVDITVTKGTGTTGLGSVTFEELGSVTVSQSGQVITLDGTLNHVESWPEFSSKPEDLKGYYLPLVLEGPEGSYFGKKTADGTWKTVSIADCDLAHGGMVIAVAKDTPAITFQMFASQSDATAQKDGTTYTVDLSGVTYAE